MSKVTPIDNHPSRARDALLPKSGVAALFDLGGITMARGVLKLYCTAILAFGLMHPFTLTYGLRISRMRDDGLGIFQIDTV